VLIIQIRVICVLFF